MHRNKLPRMHSKLLLPVDLSATCMLVSPEPVLQHTPVHAMGWLTCQILLCNNLRSLCYVWATYLQVCMKTSNRDKACKCSRGCKGQMKARTAAQQGQPTALACIAGRNMDGGCRNKARGSVVRNQCKASWGLSSVMGASSVLSAATCAVEKKLGAWLLGFALAEGSNEKATLLRL